ncbi:MAG: glycosyltransferase family 4 protein [Lentisphaerota bacterium]
MKKKRILYIHHGSTHGGAPLSLLSLLNYLDRSRYECIVCSSECDLAVEEFFRQNNFEVCKCRLPRFAHTTLGTYNLLKYSGWRQVLKWTLEYKAAARRLEALLKELKPDLVHFNSLTLAPYTKVPCKIGIPNIVHVREPIVNGLFGIRKRCLTTHLNRYASQVIAICKDNLDRLQLNEGRGQVIYNPIDFKKFDATIDKQQARSALGIAPGANVVLFAGGSVSEAKGLYEFLEATAIVNSKNDNLTCLMPSFKFATSPQERRWTLKRRIGWILGIYRKSDRLFRLIENNGLKEKIISSEFTNEIERWIAASDIVCAPHILPHFSRTVIEAGAMKKPVVAFRIGGIEEVVINGKTGLLVEVGDVSGLARAIQELFCKEDKGRRMGESGWQQAKQFFSADISSAQVAAVYEELLYSTKKE